MSSIIDKGDYMERKSTRVIRVGNRLIGGDNPITVQSMTNTVTSDIDKTVAQIIRLEDAGCDIIRVAISNFDDANAIQEIKKNINMIINLHWSLLNMG